LPESAHSITTIGLVMVAGMAAEMQEQGEFPFNAVCSCIITDSPPNFIIYWFNWCMFRAPRCRCRVAFDMTDQAFVPRLDRCYLAHFHDNKYRFQSRRFKHEWDGGNYTTPNPIALFYGSRQDEFRDDLSYGIPFSTSAG
jgi:hypothetical protein